MTPTGIFSSRNTGISPSSATPFLELQVDANTIIEILRAWVSADVETTPPPADEGYPIELYGNDVISTGGSPETPRSMNGAVASTGVTEVGGTGLTIGATPTPLISDVYYSRTGWLYLPTPEERFVIGAAGVLDVVGLRFPLAPTRSPVVSYGIIFAEYSLA